MTKAMKKAVPMINSCDAPKIMLSNGMRIRITYKKILDGTFMDMWLTDSDGHYVTSRTITYKTEADRARKLEAVFNEIKLEVIAYEVGKATEAKQDIADIISLIDKRYSELKIKKLQSSTVDLTWYITSEVNMSLRVYAEAKVLISQDNATNPQEPTFNSGSKNFTDTSTYNESVGFTFDVPASAVDTQVSLGSLTSAELVYLMAKGTGLTVKLVPVGGSLGATPAHTIIANVPAVIPFKIKEVYVSNPGVSAIKLVIGAAGN